MMQSLLPDDATQDDRREALQLLEFVYRCKCRMRKDFMRTFKSYANPYDLSKLHCEFCGGEITEEFEFRLDTWQSAYYRKWI